MTPSIGRIVHVKVEGNFQTEAPLIIPAIITRVVGDGVVNLRLFTDHAPAASDSMKGVQHGDGDGQWSWPSRVP